MTEIPWDVLGVGGSHAVTLGVGSEGEGNPASQGREALQEELMVTVVHVADKGWDSGFNNDKKVTIIVVSEFGSSPRQGLENK